MAVSPKKTFQHSTELEQSKIWSLEEKKQSSCSSKRHNQPMTTLPNGQGRITIIQYKICLLYISC